VAGAPRAQCGAPRVNGLGRVLELQARTLGGASSVEAPIMLGICPVDPKKSRQGVVCWRCQASSPSVCESGDQGQAS
jgi:hypothetical protein